MIHLFPLTKPDYSTTLRNMSNPNIDINDEEQVRNYAKIFKALSNPHRLKIMLELTRCSGSEGSFTTSIGIDQVENCQQEFAKNLGLAPSTISHHFKELRQAGLLKMKKEGKNMIVWVDANVINSIKNLF